jgi:hypothetical protein
MYEYVLEQIEKKSGLQKNMYSIKESLLLFYIS